MAKPARNITHERAADSILALINSRPRSPTKAELIECLAGRELVGSVANDNRPGPEPHARAGSQPTWLGLEAVKRMGDWVEAASQRAWTADLRTAPDFDAGVLAAADEAEDRTATAYREAIKDILVSAESDPGKHLVDLAIVVRIDYCAGCEPDERWKKAVSLLVEWILKPCGVTVPTQDEVSRQFDHLEQHEPELQPNWRGNVVPFRLQ